MGYPPPDPNVEIGIIGISSLRSYVYADVRFGGYGKDVRPANKQSRMEVKTEPGNAR